MYRHDVASADLQANPAKYGLKIEKDPEFIRVCPHVGCGLRPIDSNRWLNAAVGGRAYGRAHYGRDKVAKPVGPVIG